MSVRHRHCLHLHTPGFHASDYALPLRGLAGTRTCTKIDMHVRARGQVLYLQHTIVTYVTPCANVPDLALSIDYAPFGRCWHRSDLGQNLSMVAVCEVIKHPDVKVRYACRALLDICRTSFKAYWDVCNERGCTAGVILQVFLEVP